MSVATSNPPDTLFDRAKRFFDGIGKSEKLKQDLATFDQIAQFVPCDGEPFFVRINAGVVELGKGEKYPKDIEDGLYIVEIHSVFDAIFKGEMTLGEAIFHQKIRIPGYRNKEPVIASFSKTLRLGIWALVSGSPLFKPAR